MGSQRQHLVFQVLMLRFFHIPPLIQITPICAGKIGGIIDKRRSLAFENSVPALVRSPALVTVSRSRVTAHFPSRGIPFQMVIRFSRGLSIDELSQVYTFLISCAVYP